MEELSSLLPVLRAILAEGPPLHLAVLFGSAARGRTHPGSDVDVAIWPQSPELPLGAELDLQVALERAVGRPVDLLRLDEASTMVCWEVAAHGVPIVAATAAAWPRFVARAASEWADFRPALEEAARRFQRRLAEPVP